MIKLPQGEKNSKLRTQQKWLYKEPDILEQLP